MADHEREAIAGRAPQYAALYRRAADDGTRSGAGLGRVWRSQHPRRSQDKGATIGGGGGVTSVCRGALLLQTFVPLARYFFMVVPFGVVTVVTPSNPSTLKHHLL